MNHHRIVRITRDDYRKIRQGLIEVTAGRFGRQQVARLVDQSGEIRQLFEKYGIESDYVYGGVFERFVGPGGAPRWFMMGASEEGLAFLTPLRLIYAATDASSQEPKQNRVAA
jgi:hypothetical protein